MSCTSLSNVAEERMNVLNRLRARRVRSRRNEVIVGAHLLQLKNNGDITSAEFEYVMGLNGTKKRGVKE